MDNAEFIRLYKPPDVPDELITLFNGLPERINYQGNDLDKLEEIYNYLNEFLLFVSTFTVCKINCCECCQINVSITKLEAEYISVKSRKIIQIASPQRTDYSGQKCTFLREDKSCGIYNYRPYNCRTYHTVDNPEYCNIEKDREHIVYGSPDGRYSTPILQILSNWIKQ
jgi:uncharacterized protein